MTEDWKPYNYEKDGIVQGISTDIFVLMLEKIGSKQGRKDIKIYPWIRAYKKIQKTPNSILFTTTRTQEREKIFKWVGPIFVMQFNIYAMKNRNIKISSFEDIRNYQIGTLRGDVTEDLLIKKTGMNISMFQRANKNLLITKMLSVRRVDLAVYSEDTLITTTQEAGINIDEIEPVFILDKKSMYYAFHKDTPDSVIAKFQSIFDSLKENGKVAEIFQSYSK